MTPAPMQKRNHPGWLQGLSSEVEVRCQREHGSRHRLFPLSTALGWVYASRSSGNP